MRSVLRFLVLTLTFIVCATQPAQAGRAPDSFADLAEKLLPAVVNISTSQMISQQRGGPSFDLQLPESSPFNEFFQDFMKQHQPRLPNGGARKHKAASLGSGFIIDPKGYIVTNYHVIQDADEITVILQDDTNLKAKIVGRDKKTDLALLKVENKKILPALTFGDSDKVRVGDWIVAIGNPYGLGGTVTAGIISARARNINSGPYDDYLQTDASINRGNSGGPMFNMKGEVIGINTAIFSPTGGSVGIGFAIPSSMAKGVISQLKNTGHTRRGWLGVRIQTVTPEISKSLGLKTPKGALVSSVTKDGPAAKAGLHVGDVILKFNGKDVTEMHKLPRYVAETKIGNKSTVTVLRKGKTKTITVKIGELEADADEDKKTNFKTKADDGEEIKPLSIHVSKLSKSLRKKYNIKKNTNGVIILKVAPDSLAYEAGMRRTDIISQAAQEDITSAKQLRKIARASKKSGKPLLLLVEREGNVRFIALKLEK